MRIQFFKLLSGFIISIFSINAFAVVADDNVPTDFSQNVEYAGKVTIDNEGDKPIIVSVDKSNCKIDSGGSSVTIKKGANIVAKFIGRCDAIVIRYHEKEEPICQIGVNSLGLLYNSKGSDCLAGGRLSDDNSKIIYRPQQN
ncbi:MAG: hypothetical protein CMF50_04880 [Legionellales bacterium]|nr:hypothetical protein [Legionellales bacterium]|tara:strand:- start:21332 stop:21757 length:426 start_codon:yes stop_codon:yes gene_type:complete